MKRVKSLLCASLLTAALASGAFAGNITTLTAPGNITTAPGNITTAPGNITTKPGNITTWAEYILLLVSLVG